MTKRSFTDTLKDPQYIIAIGVTLISVCALVVSVKQTNIMAEQRALMLEQAKAAVWPRVSVSYSKTHSKTDYSIEDLSLIVSNAGVGPAIISDIRVTYNGKTAKHWWKLFEILEIPDSIPKYVTNQNISNNIIKAGDQFKVLSLKDNLPLANEFFKHIRKIKYEVFYESIYGDKWKFTADTLGIRTEIIDPEYTVPEKEQFRN